MLIINMTVLLFSTIAKVKYAIIKFNITQLKVHAILQAVFIIYRTMNYFKSGHIII